MHGVVCRAALFSPDERVKHELEDVAEILWIPLIELEPIEGCSRRVVEALERCSLAVVVSPRTIEIVARDAARLGIMDRVSDVLRRSTVAVIGEHTYRSIVRFAGVKPQIVSPAPYTRELFKYIVDRGFKCAVYLKAQSSAVDLTSMNGLISVEEVVVYRYREVHENAERVRMVLSRGGVDAVVLTSYTIAKLFSSYIEASMLRGVAVVAIGRTTASGISRGVYELSRVLIGSGTIDSVKRIVESVCRCKVGVSSCAPTPIH